MLVKSRGKIFRKLPFYFPFPLLRRENILRNWGNEIYELFFVFAPFGDKEKTKASPKKESKPYKDAITEVNHIITP